jgi:hypothetical protein
MKSRKISMPLILNLALLTALAAITFAPDSIRANAQAGRARGEYTLLAGRPNGSSSDAIYVLDAANQEIIALKWDTGRKLSLLGYRNLESDAKLNPTR